MRGYSKKNAGPELSEKWWSDNKDLTVPKTGVGHALKSHEMAKYSGSPNHEEMLKRLEKAQQKAKSAIGKCNKKLSADVISALE
ncbi:MAG: hypothetical protein NTX73_17620 [Rhodobacterales bacterium]|nr:hypothetical protein [Rhodobacterales bacterium]